MQLQAKPVDGTALFLTAGRGIAMPNAGPNALLAGTRPTVSPPRWKRVRSGARARGEEGRRRQDLGRRPEQDRHAASTITLSTHHPGGTCAQGFVSSLTSTTSLTRRNSCAGIDGFAHGIRDLEVDDEIMALFKARPQFFLIPNLPDTPPFGNDLVWLSETLPGRRSKR